MHTLGDMAKALNRAPVYVSGLQRRFELPVFAGARYSDAYLAFLRTLVHLRTLWIPEEAILALWKIEKKMLQLLHVDSAGSPTWFLDACGLKKNLNRRLLLSNYDIGVDISGTRLQLGLNFARSTPELFSGKEMGEDAIRLLKEYLKLYSSMRSEIDAAVPNVRAAATWAARRIRTCNKQ